MIDTATGEVVQRIDYDEYGNILQDTNPGFIPFGYGAGMYDQHTKLLRFGARDYDTHAGRWTAKDPARFNYGEFNMYWYVGNDPVNRVDPTGLFKTEGDCCGRDKEVTDGAEKGCNENAGKIKEKALAKCVKERCENDNSTIKCVCPNWFLDWFYDYPIAYTRPGLYKTYVCVNRMGPDRIGQGIVHELAHQCGWPGDHPKSWKAGNDVHNRSGVPFPEGGAPRGNDEPFCPKCTEQ